MLLHISHITIFVSNQDEALAFYRKLGFEIHTDALFGEMRWLTICLPINKQFEVVLMLAVTPEEKALVGKQTADKPLMSFETSDCHGDYKRLSSEGVTFIEEPEEQPWGISALLQDPCGNRLYMCQSRS